MDASHQHVETLKSMFPNFDADVLESVLAVCDHNVEAAIEQLMQMDPQQATTSESGTDADEELAYAAFQQFAVELEQDLRKRGKEIPAGISSDPVKYQAFIIEQMQQLENAELQKRLGKVRGGKESFMRRFSKPSAAKGVFRQIAVERTSDTSLLTDQQRKVRSEGGFDHV